MTALWSRYEPTTARPRGRPGREIRPRSLTVDIHAHVAVPHAEDFVRPHLDPTKVPLGHFADPLTKALAAKQDDDIRERIAGNDERLRHLDEMGIDIQVVCPAPPQCYYTVPIEVGVPAMRMVNEGLAEFVARWPDRYVALGGVPLTDGHEAAKELEHCMTVLGFKGVEILTNVAGRELSDPAFEPFWAKAEALGALVLIHPIGFTHAQRLTRFYFNNVIGNPLETTIALHYLIFDGVLERHPNLKILAVHGGGFLGAYHGRIDHAWGARADSHGDLPKPPTEYLKRVYFDSVVFTPAQLEALVKTFGADHVLMGTDYPFDMADYNPVEHVIATGFDLDTTAKLVGGNARRLLGI